MKSVIGLGLNIKSLVMIDNQIFLLSLYFRSSLISTQKVWRKCQLWIVKDGSYGA